MEPWAKHIMLSQHQVVVLTYEVILSISYRMTQDPLCSFSSQLFPNTSSSREICLEFIYGDHKEALSDLENVMPVDLSKQGNRKPRS